MTICMFCGTKLMDGARFCYKCERKLEYPEEQPPPPTNKFDFDIAGLETDTEKESQRELHDMAVLHGVGGEVAKREAKYRNIRSLDETKAKIAPVISPSIHFGDRGVAKRYCPVCEKELTEKNEAEKCTHCDRKFCESCAGKAKKWAKRVGVEEIPVQLLDEYDEPMCKACWKECRFAITKLEKDKRYREEQERKERERREAKRKRLEEERKKSEAPKAPPEFTNSIGMKFVKISGRNYYMGKHQVTQKEWKVVMGSNPSYFKGDDLPVEQVSWDDCQEYIERLNRKEGTYKYRLPTEEEWEHACRAGSTTGYCFGDDVGKLGTYAWYGDNSGSKTHIVGTKRPNMWGLHDMHGNVWEWCQDWYDNKHKYRVLRGGGWSNTADYCESSFRYRNLPDNRCNYLGVRLARSSD